MAQGGDAGNGPWQLMGRRLSAVAPRRVWAGVAVRSGRSKEVECGGGGECGRRRQVAEPFPSSFPPQSPPVPASPSSPLSPELCCHEAEEALQLRTPGPRTGFFRCPAGRAPPDVQA